LGQIVCLRKVCCSMMIKGRSEIGVTVQTILLALDGMLFHFDMVANLS